MTDEESSDERPKLVRSDSLPATPERIVSLAPNFTEIMFALGVGDRVVGVTKYCNHPEEASERPVIGSFSNPNFEAILARDPDLVGGVISGGKREVVERLEGAGLNYVFVRMSTIGETFEGIRRLGQIVGRGERAEALTAEMRNELAELEERWSDAKPPRVLLVYGHDPLVAAGPDTFGDELLARAGAENVLADAETRYPRLDAEKLIELAPERIVDTAMAERSKARSFWNSYTSSSALGELRIVQLTGEAVMRPGPRLPRALETMGRAIHGTSDSDIESDDRILEITP